MSSVSIKRSVVEQFSFDGKSVRSVFVKDIGECLVACDVCAAIGYSDERCGRRAIQRHVPKKYQVRYKHVKNELGRRVQLNPPQDDQILLKEPGLYCFLLRCKMEKANPFMEWVCEEILPRAVRKLAAELDEEKHKVQVKDTQLALLDEDIRHVQRNVVVLEQKNLELQARVEQLNVRAVPHLEDYKKDNGICVIQKNNDDPYPYIAICGQQGYVAQKIQNKLVDYPNGQIVVLRETPNAVVHYNWLRERGCIVVNPDRARHFRLGENYSHQRLMELQDA